jgi:hypothetical protein
MTDDSPVSTLNDLLSADMSNVDTSYPVLAKGLKELVIAEVKEVDNKAQTGKVLEVHLKTTLPDVNIQAKPGTDNVVQAGFPILHRIGLTPTDKYTIAMIKRAIAIFKEAVFGDKNTPAQPADFAGRNVMAQVTIENSQEFGNQNRISRFVPRK